MIFFNLLSFASFGEPYTENGVKYDFKIDDTTNTGTLTISKDDDVSDDIMPKREVSKNGVNKAIGRPDMDIPDTTVTTVIIEVGITSIGEEAFYWCTALTSIIMPSNVGSICMFAFYNCGNLNDVYYLGTQEDWNDITIYDNNDPLTNAKKHYNCNILTVKKVWDDNNNSGLRRKLQFVLYKLNSGGGHDKINNEDGEKYKEWEVTYVNGLPVEFDSTGKVTNDGAEKDVWLCKFIIFDHVADNKYAVSEDPMVGYTSSAPTPKSTTSQ